MITTRILFGTETGNAEDCALELGSMMNDAGFPAEVTDLDDFEPTALAREALAIVITSTYGNGDPPCSAEAMMEWLQSDTAAVPGVAFAVCGLGDETYPFFARCGKEFDRLLEVRGGRRILPRIDCDVDFEEPFEEFAESLLGWMREHAGTLGAPEVGAAPAASTTPKAKRKSEIQATLASRRLLSGPGSTKETMHYELSWAPAEVEFAPGDSFSVVPRNNPAEVDAVLEGLGLDPATSVSVGDDPRTVHDALLDGLDLQVVPSALRAAWPGADRAPDDAHLIDIVRLHPAGPAAQELVDGLKRIKPRLYSVANSPKVDDSAVHFTVETLRYEHYERACEGVASTWLADRLEDGDGLILKRVPAPHFRLPEDPGTPIVMVGAGTGLAPYRAFLQDRAATDGAGDAWLFFGHRNEGSDFLYQEEIEAWVADGTLTRFTPAWSRDQPEKVYVQHRIREFGAELWRMLDAGASVYVCGDKFAMAPGVRAAFLAVLQEHGSRSPEEAESTLATWETGGRYAVDAY